MAGYRPMSTADDLSTRPSLVRGLRDAGNHAAWLRFCGLYQERLRSACACFGVAPSDLDDVVAEVLQRVAAALTAGWVYDPSRSFRGWLTTLCRNEAARYLARTNGQAALGGVGTGDDRVRAALHQVSVAEAEVVEVEWAEVVRASAEQVRSQISKVQWDSFTLNGVEKLSATVVAAQLGVLRTTVWQNKHRVALLIRAEVQRRLDAGE